MGDAIHSESVARLEQLLAVVPEGYGKKKFLSDHLSTAVYTGNKHVVEALLRGGADIDRSLNGALRRGCPSIWRVLLDHGIEVLKKDSEDFPPIYWAVYYFTSYAMAQRSRSVDVTSLQTYKKKFESIRLLLEAGCDVNQASKGLSLLFLVVRCNLPSTDLLSMLLSYRANVNSRDSNGATPLMVAAQKSTVLEVLKTLVDHGANIHDRCNDGNTALHHAASHSNREALIWLMDNGADTDALNNKSQSFVDSLPFLKCATILDKVLGKGLFPDKVKLELHPQDHFYKMLQKCEFGLSPTLLSVAVLRGCSETATLLRDIGFLTGEDLKWLTGNRDVRDKLPSWSHLAYDSIVVSDPCSLHLISFVKISDLLGGSPHREQRVKQLALPGSLQQQLLFKRLQAKFKFHSLIQKRNCITFKK